MHPGRITAMPDRSLAVVAEIEKAVSGAREARIRRVQGAVHLLGRDFFQNTHLSNISIAVAAVLQVCDHEPGHIRGAGIHSARWHHPRLTQVIWINLEVPIYIGISLG